MLTALDRRAIAILAEREWDATRHTRRHKGQRPDEPTWQELGVELRALWILNIEKFIGQYLAIREQLAA